MQYVIFLGMVKMSYVSENINFRMQLIKQLFYFMEKILKRDLNIISIAIILNEI